jgi:predicted nucleic acid-binding protein
MAVISNTSPLIALAKIRRLQLLKDLYGSVVMPPFVRVECIDNGREIGAPDAYEIEKAVQEGWIKAATLDRKWKTRVNNLMQRAPIGQGEAEALIIAREKGIPVVLDDADARALARALGIEHMGTLMIPYEAVIKGLIRYDELVSILTGLSKVLWVSPAVIAEILRKAQETRK